MSRKRRFDTSVIVNVYDPATHRFAKSTTYRDASVRKLDRHGLYPGMQLQLRSSKIDEETGTELDVDGDRAFEREYLYGADLILCDDDQLWKGYAEIGRYSAQFCLVEWHVFPYKWLVRREREAAQNARKGVELSERALGLLHALVELENENRNSARGGSEFLSIPEGRTVQVGEFEIADDDPALLELRDKVGVGVYKHDREEMVRVPADEGYWQTLKTTGVIVHTEGRDIAEKYK